MQLIKTIFMRYLQGRNGDAAIKSGLVDTMGKGESESVSRQEYWSGLLFSSPGDLPNPGIKPWSPSLLAFFTA